MKKPPPLLGYNTNVRHSGKLFHIQTEDSGIDHPHIITHLFVEGTILATKKNSYDHVLSEPEWEKKVREMMKDQHRQMFVELRDGIHDTVAATLDGEPVPLGPDGLPSEPPPERQSMAPTIDIDEKQGVRVIRPAAMGDRPTPAPTAKPAEVSEAAKGRSIFDTPRNEGEFGDNLITDKSLDEVILSYLTDELDES
jgi:hypothetical protein